MSTDEKTYKGQCFCGAVTIEVTGDPEGAGYDHCGPCRSWSAGPGNAFTLWKPEAVKVTQGEENMGEYHDNERRQRCATWDRPTAEKHGGLPRLSRSWRCHMTWRRHTSTAVSYSLSVIRTTPASNSALAFSDGPISDSTALIGTGGSHAST